MLIQLKNKGTIDGEMSTDTRRLTLGQCIAQSFIFLLGGAEENSAVISYVLLELSHHLEIQERLRNEIETVLEHSNGEITYESLNQMTYLNQVINGR